LKRMIQEGSVAATYAQELYNEHGTNAVEILKKAQEEQASGNDGKKAPKKLTKKSVEKGPRLGKKVVEAMHRGVSSITSRLDNIKPNDDGETFTLTLSREDVDAFQELKAKLAELEPKTDESNEDQQELDLAGNQ
ncbi:chromosome partitioning protein ParB, partial [Salmonella enterica subsp. enterica serovar Typhimurium]|nr:chromosome partitioning protein ParB [Salmonella enterica subsp. enterica serovar Typhimurium]